MRTGAAVSPATRAPRDRIREHAFLAAPARLHGHAGECWAASARLRLEAGQAAYGDRWRTLGLPRLLDELAEEAADLGAWAALAEQALDGADLDPVDAVEVRRALEVAASAGAAAYAALLVPRRALGGSA